MLTRLKCNRLLHTISYHFPRGGDSLVMGSFSIPKLPIMVKLRLDTLSCSSIALSWLTMPLMHHLQFLTNSNRFVILKHSCSNSSFGIRSLFRQYGLSTNSNLHHVPGSPCPYSTHLHPSFLHPSRNIHQFSSKIHLRSTPPSMQISMESNYHDFLLYS